MILETLGAYKALIALKCAATGLAAAAPVVVSHSAQATGKIVQVTTPVVLQSAALAGQAIQNGAVAAQQVVVTTTPIITHGATTLIAALPTLGAGIAKGAMALQHGVTSFVAGKAATV